MNRIIWVKLMHKGELSTVGGILYSQLLSLTAFPQIYYHTKPIIPSNQHDILDNIRNIVYEKIR